MDSKGKCNSKIANSGLAQCLLNDKHCIQRTILERSVDIEVSHYICRILIVLLNSGRNYSIVYQSYFSQVLNGRLLFRYTKVQVGIDRDFYNVVSDTPYNYLFNHIQFNSILSGARVSLYHSL